MALGISIIAGVLVVFPALLVAGDLYERRRSRQIAALADELGFAFGTPHRAGLVLSDASDPALVGALPRRDDARFPEQRAMNVMSGDVEGTRVALFDLTRMEGSGFRTETFRQSAALLRNDSWDLPEFQLHPRQIMVMALEPATGASEVTFRSHPHFHRQYVLRGPDPASIRAVFTDDLLTFCVGNGGLCLEGGGHRLLVSSGTKRLPVSRLSEFFIEICMLLDLFHAPKPPPSPDPDDEFASW